MNGFARTLSTDWEGAGVCAALRRTAAALGDATIAPWMLGGSVAESARRGGPSTPARLCAARVRAGARLEAHLARACDADSAAPSEATAPPPLWFDAYAAATWTSAHAHALALASVRQRPVCMPALSAQPCASSARCLARLLERVACATRPVRAVPEDAQRLCALLTRCTNPSVRGWISALSNALASVGARATVLHAVRACALGLHPYLPPAARRPWPDRLRAQLAPSSALFRSDELLRAPLFTKEAVRMAIAFQLAHAPCLLQILRAMRHPACMAGRSALVAVALHRAADEPTGAAIDARFERETQGTGWRLGWMGKCTSTGCARATPLAAVVDALHYETFKAQFAPFWIHARTHGTRATRLEAAQHRAMHQSNAVTRAANALDPLVALRVQRAALETAGAALLSASEVARLLGLGAVVGLDERCAQRGACAALRALPAAHASQLLAFGRAARARELVRVVALGARTADAQARAVRARARIAADAPLPRTFARLFVCSVCRRVATPHVDGEHASGAAHAELGVSACQLRVPTCATRAPSLICAKRPSAAWRQARATELAIKRRRLDERAVRERAVRVATTQLDTTGGIAARFRRDCRTAFGQPPALVGCAERALLEFDLMGRAVRVLGAWHALCATCGVVFRVQATVRWNGALVSCAPCARAGATAARATVASKADARCCRFCGLVRSQAAFTRVHAPLDTSGANEHTPPALRHVHYCRACYRPWVADAHRALSSQQVLAHLALGARPVIDATR